jgi:transposase
MGLYAGIDLHSNNSYLGIINQEGKKIAGFKTPNEEEIILKIFEPYKKDLVGAAVESTFNWYWLVDLLMEAGYKLHLANPSAIQKYSGLKYSDDRHDSFWLAEMLRLGILPEGYIYPRERRPVRDLLRKRGHLVRLRTSLILSLKNSILRSTGKSLSVNEIRAVRVDHITPLLPDEPHLRLRADADKKSIDYLSLRIKELETEVERSTRGMSGYEPLLSIPGVGRILSMVIFLETGDINRFPKAGNYTSYCRKAPTSWTSNGKRKGAGNKKNGNKYLAWAFSEAAEKIRIFDEKAKAYYQRKAAKTNRMVAHSALAHKLAKAAFYIQRDQVRFDGKKTFA